MSNSSPRLFEETNLSHAWAKAFLLVTDDRDYSGKKISPLVVSITGFNDGIPNEDQEIRQSLDKCLADAGDQDIHTVANTIFPESLWKRSQYQRQEFEVAECSFGDWEKAILMGYEVWRQVERNRGGTVVVDLEARSIAYQVS